MLIACFLTLTNILLQILIGHLFRPGRTFPLFVGLFLLSLPAYVLLSFQNGLSDFGFLGGLVIYLLLYCNYIQCFYYIATPLTLRMVEEFFCAPGGFLSLLELKERYGVAQIIRERLVTLEKSGYLKKEGERCLLTRRGNFFAQAFKLLRKIFGVPYYLEVGVG